MFENCIVDNDFWLLIRAIWLFQVDSPTVGVGAGVESSKREKLSYQIVSISNKDVDDVIGFLRTFFFRDEPLNVAVNLLDTPDAVCHELEQFCTDFIPEGIV